MSVRTVQLGDLIDISKGKKASQIFERPTEGSLRYLQIDDLRPDARPKYVKPFDCPKASKSDVVIAWDGANAGTVSCNLDGYIGSTLAVLRPSSEKVFAPYLARFLEGNFGFLQAQSTGATVPHLDRQVLEELELPLPDLSEQKRIAALLERADRLRRTRRYALELSDTFLPATFNAMFGSPFEAFRRWPIDRLDDCCLRITDGTHLTPKFLCEGVPFIFVKNIENGRIDYRTDKFISEETHCELYRRCPIEEHDILYTIVGATYGQAAAVGNFTKFAFQRHVAHLKPDRVKVIPQFLVTIMQLPIVKAQADRWARGAAQPTINLKELKEFLIPIPPIPRQQHFAAMVARHEHLRAEQREAVRQADHLFHSLLHRAFKWVN